MNKKLICIIFSVFFTFFLQAEEDKTKENKAKEDKKAYLAGGCFWCMEEAFEKIDGVKEVISGYAGPKGNPNYSNVSSGRTPYIEAVEIIYDASQVTYKELLEHFWVNINPTQDKGQFCDLGNQYSSVAYYESKSEKSTIEKTETQAKDKINSKKKFVTRIEKFNSFYPAEDYHQNYYRTNAARYKYYKNACKRPQTLESLWE